MGTVCVHTISYDDENSKKIDQVLKQELQEERKKRKSCYNITFRARGIRQNYDFKTNENIIARA